jgi:hypothetical protein
VVESQGEHGVADRGLGGDDDAGPGGQGAADGISVEGVGDLFGGGGDELAVVAEGDRRCGLDRGEFGLDVTAPAGDSVAGQDALCGEQRIGVGVGGPVVAGVGVKSLAFGGDIAGHDAPDNRDADAVQSVAQGVQHGVGMLVESLVAHGEQDRGVVVDRPQVAGGREVRGLSAVTVMSKRMAQRMISSSVGSRCSM